MEVKCLPILERTHALIQKSIENYQRYARLRLSIDTVGHKMTWCTAYQYEPAPNGKVLTADEILRRAREAFAPLAEEGLTPIICVYTVSDGSPDAPVTKHRLVEDLEFRGIRSKVLRIAPPRVLFTQDGNELKLLEAEAIAPLHFWPQLKYQAEQWLKRIPYRSIPGKDRGSAFRN